MKNAFLTRKLYRQCIGANEIVDAPKATHHLASYKLMCCKKPMTAFEIAKHKKLQKLVE